MGPFVRLGGPRDGLCSPLLPRCSQRHAEFRCLLIRGSYAPLQSASDYRGLGLLSCQRLERTDVLFRPIPPLHCLLSHLCSPFKPAARSARHVEQKCLIIGKLTRPTPQTDLSPFITSALPDAAQSDRRENGTPPCNRGRRRTACR